MVHHGEALRAATKDDHLVYHLERAAAGADLDAQDRAMLAFARKLNFEPGRIAQEDVDALHSSGFDDRGVVDIVLIVSLFNFLNRIVDGVGIRAEEPFRQVKARGDARVEAALAGKEAATGD
jgi:uncharacterized peroxidase-related enzyme